jgi:hypothetical protein
VIGALEDDEDYKAFESAIIALEQNYSRDLLPAVWGSGISSHHSNPEPPMSALGQKRTSERVRLMSALPPKADMAQHGRDVRFVPEAEVGNLKG